MPQVLKGTSEEITRALETEPYAGKNLKVYVEVEEDEEDLAAGIPDPPFTVRDRAHLEELLLEGMEGPYIEYSENTFAKLKEEIRNRFPK